MLRGCFPNLFPCIIPRKESRFEAIVQELEKYDSDCDSTDSGYEDDNVSTLSHVSSSCSCSYSLSDEDDCEENDTEDYKLDILEKHLHFGPQTFISPGLRGFLSENPIDFSNMDLKKDPPRAGNMTGGIQTSLPISLVPVKGLLDDLEIADHHLHTDHPLHVLKSIVESRGSAFRTVHYKMVRNTFLKVTNEMITAHDIMITAALRQNDVIVLRALHKMGHPLQCCNRFGESIIHTVARRGLYKMLDFLVNEANVSMRVICDGGRTPLHDACWTTAPNFDAIRLILVDCPDFLLIEDERNLTPLSYVPRSAWRDWCCFLKEHAQLITTIDSFPIK